LETEKRDTVIGGLLKALPALLGAHTVILLEREALALWIPSLLLCPSKILGRGTQIIFPVRHCK
jgi:hypothetical protein